MALFIKDGKIYLTLNLKEWETKYTYYPIEHERYVIAVGVIGHVSYPNDTFVSFFIDDEYKLFKIEVNDSGDITKTALFSDEFIVDYSENSNYLASAINIDGDLLINDEDYNLVKIPLGVKFTKTLVDKEVTVVALDKNGNLWGNDYCRISIFGQKIADPNIFNFTQLTNNLNIKNFDIETVYKKEGRLAAVSTYGEIYIFESLSGVATKINLGVIVANKCLITKNKLYILDQSQNLWERDLIYLHANLDFVLLDEQIKSISRVMYDNYYDNILILLNDGRIKQIGTQTLKPQRSNYNYYVFQDEINNFDQTSQMEFADFIQDLGIYNDFRVDSIPGDSLGNTNLNKRFGHTKKAFK